MTIAGPLYGADKWMAYRSSELFVLPSHQENFGIAVVEALASGCPVLISDQVNIHREITAAGVGVVLPTDQNDIARELKRWMDDENLRREAGGRGPAFVRQRYDWNVIAGHWASHYERLVTAATR
mgnify:CR=1 FL=1